MRRQLKKRGKTGFSLLEVVFAFALLELVMLALIGAFPAIANLNKNARFQSYANQYAMEKMEQIISQQYVINPGNMPANLDPNDNADNEKLLDYAKKFWSQYEELPVPESINESGTDKTFTRIWWAENITYSSPLKRGSSVLQKVTVRVMWTEGSGDNKRERSIDLVCQCVLAYSESVKFTGSGKDETK